MDGKAKQFFEWISGKRIALMGIGVTNLPLALMFAEHGAKVTARDKNTREKLGDVCGKLEAAGVTLLLGEDYLQDLYEDIIFRTPGMRFDIPELEQARARGAVITSEMEVFFDLCPCKTYAVTGSDGKTTTTTLISEMLKTAGYTVHLGGNIGRPLLPRIGEIEPGDVAVAELSSFQLITMRESPDVAVVTNLAPNHLDIHKDLEEYIESKRNILYHQNAFSKAVLNLDNHTTRSMQSLVRGELRMFSRLETVDNGAFLRDGAIYMDRFDSKVKVMERSDIKLVGDHNVENYLAAISAVWDDVKPEHIVEVARSFGGVQHRMELVRERDGVTWYNDSIATNPTRTIAGLNAYDRKVILIAGGYDKHLPFGPMVPAVLEKVKALILMGVTAKAIFEAVTSNPNYSPEKLPIVFVNNMEEAVQQADRLSESGDIVTLSPASASFDQYKNFEVRGDHFKSIVNGL
ncbi:MAG: UDP-N-acetylmuramoyl-L-alanine--D-glutamate ligase [Clostridiales bacterium]|nr:UDP-N-acetylmuramoyl-L-alanine--D-glutamate ligase [Clostridiales bacterium]